MFNETHDLLPFDLETSEAFFDYLAMQQDTYSWIDHEGGALWANTNSEEDSVWDDSMFSYDSDGDCKMDLRVSYAELPRYDGLGDIYANVQKNSLGIVSPTLMANGRVTVTKLPKPFMRQHPPIMTSREIQMTRAETILDNHLNKKQNK